MSAWTISRDRLDLLITAALAWELTTPDDGDETGRTLWKEKRRQRRPQLPGRPRRRATAVQLA